VTFAISMTMELGTPAEAALRRVADKYGIRSGSAFSTAKALQFSPEALPILPFFQDLAEDLGVSLGDIRVEHEGGGDGCPTCGYGAECSWTVYVDISATAERQG